MKAIAFNKHFHVHKRALKKLLFDGSALPLFDITKLYAIECEAHWCPLTLMAAVEFITHNNKRNDEKKI